MRTSYCVAFVLLIALGIVCAPRACLAWPEPCPDWLAPDVTDDGDYTCSTSQLHASWTPTGKTEYWYAIGTSPGAEDIVVRTSTDGEAEVTKGGLSLTVGQTYYFTVQYYDDGGDCYSQKGCSDGIIVVNLSSTILGALQQPDSTQVTIQDAVVSADTSDFPDQYDYGCSHFYVQQVIDGRVYGLQVRDDTYSLSVSRGDVVNLTGTIEAGWLPNDLGERVLVITDVNDVTVVDSTTPPSPPAEIQLMATVGGEDLNEYTLGVNTPPPPPGTPYNIGTLVKISGLVRSVDSDWVYVDDGSLEGDDGTGENGVRVDWSWTNPGPPQQVPVVGDVVEVAGVSGCMSPNYEPEKRCRIIRIRDDADWTVIDHYDQVTVRECRASQEGRKVCVSWCIATSETSDFDDGFYVEDLLSSLGIKATHSSESVARNDICDLLGEVTFVNGEPIVATQHTIIIEHDAMPKPYTIISLSQIPDHDGDLVVVAETVVQSVISSNEILVSDGTAECVVSSVGAGFSISASPGDSLGIRGIVGRDGGGGRVIRARDPDDVHNLLEDPDWPPSDAACWTYEAELSMGGGTGEPANCQSGIVLVKQRDSVEQSDDSCCWWQPDHCDDMDPGCLWHFGVIVEDNYYMIGSPSGIPFKVSLGRGYDHRVTEYRWSNATCDQWVAISTCDFPSGLWTLQYRGDMTKYNGDCGPVCRRTTRAYSTMSLFVNNLRVSQAEEQQPRMFYYPGGGAEINILEQEPAVQLSDGCPTTGTTSVAATIYRIDHGCWPHPNSYDSEPIAVLYVGGLDANGSVNEIMWDGICTVWELQGQPCDEGYYCYSIKASHSDPSWEAQSHCDIPAPPDPALRTSYGSDTDRDEERSSRLMITDVYANIFEIDSTGRTTVGVSYTLWGDTPEAEQVIVRAYDDELNQLASLAGPTTIGVSNIVFIGFDCVPGDLLIVVSAQEALPPDGCQLFDVDKHGRKRWSVSNGYQLHIKEDLQVGREVKGVFLHDIGFINTFTAGFECWVGPPGTIEFHLTLDDGQDHVHGPYPYSGGDPIETTYDMGDLPSGNCVVTTYLTVIAKNHKDKVIGQKTLPLKCVDIPDWTFFSDGYGVQTFIVDGCAYYEAPLLNFQNLTAEWSVGGDAARLFRKYGGKIIGFKIKESFDGGSGKYVGAIEGDFNTSGNGWASLLDKDEGDPKGEKGKWWLKDGHCMSAKLTVESKLRSGCFATVNVCASGDFGCEWKKLLALGFVGPIPVSVIGTLSLDVSPECCFDVLDLLNALPEDEKLPLSKLGVGIGVGAEIRGEAGIPGVVGVYARGTATFTGDVCYTAPPGPTCWDVPLLCDLGVDLDAYIGGEVIWIKHEIHILHYEWHCDMQGGGAAALTGPVIPGTAYYSRVSQSYLDNGEPYSTYLCGVAALSEPGGGGGDNDQAWATNVNLSATPTIASSADTTLLATSEDSGAIPGTAMHDVYAALYDGDAWSDRVAVTSNSIPDISPVAAFDTNGVPVLAWITVPDVTGSEAWEDVKPKMEVAYSYYDNGWVTPVRLTTDSYMDYYPALSNGKDGTLNLVWLCSTDSSMATVLDDELGTPADVMVSTWNGSGFNAPQMLLDGVDSLGPVSFAVDGDSEKILVWTRDADHDLATPSDLQVMEAHTVGASWSSAAALAGPGDYTSANVGPMEEGARVFYVSKGTGGDPPDDPRDELITQEFDGSSWSSAQVVMTRDSIAGASFAFDGDDVYCVWPELQDETSSLRYSRQPTGQPWQGPQELGTTDTPGGGRCAVRDGKLQVAYMATREDGLGDPIYDVRFLEHTPYANLWIAPADIALEPAEPVGGQPVQVSAEVHLAGDFNQSAVGVALYSGDPQSGGSLISSGTVDITAGMSAIYSATWDPYPADGQQHSIWAVVDSAGAVEESDEDDNVADRVAGTINLQAESWDIVDYAPDSITVEVNIANLGGAPATDVEYELRVGDQAGELIGSGTISEIAGNGVETQQVECDASGLQSDYIDIALIIDPSDDIPETSESDNNSLLDLPILPDLEIGDSWKTELVDEQKQVRITVHNLGCKASGQTVVTIIPHTGWEEIGSADVPVINPGASQEIVVPIDWQSGPCNAGVTVHPDYEDWEESDHSNNEIDVRIF